MTCDNNGQGGCEIIQFGRRPIPPRACVVENRTYVRMFLADMLDELGFIAREAGTSDIRTVLREFRPDLIVLGPLSGALEVQAFLKNAAGASLRRRRHAVRRPQLRGLDPQP